MCKKLILSFLFIVFLNNLKGQGPCPGVPTITDIDGNIYNTILIGKQCWLKENLKASKYNDGTIIPLDNSGGINGADLTQEWEHLTTGAITAYFHDYQKFSTFGFLYNWYAASDSRGICPENWHVPSEEDFNELVIYLEYLVNGTVRNTMDTTYSWLEGFDLRYQKIGGSMKFKGTKIWVEPNNGATNITGFAALPVGYRNLDGNFYNTGYDACFWTSSEYDFENGWYKGLSFQHSDIENDFKNKNMGFSIRCLKN
jgi:uncharacterized protein (TIGR02145 family)